MKMRQAFEVGRHNSQHFNMPADVTPTITQTNDHDHLLHNNNTEEEGEDSNEHDEDELFYSDDDSDFGGATSTTTRGRAFALTPSTRRGGGGGKRYRTQMTSVMLKVMKSIFADYKTPTMGECNALGREIGLPKRVVQVWFQNARAKEKKARVIYAKTFGREFDARSPKVEGCKICSVDYRAGTMQQGHLFSPAHIARLKRDIETRRANNIAGGHNNNTTNNNIDGFDDDSADFPVASGHPIPATMLVNPHSTAPVFPQSLFDSFGGVRGVGANNNNNNNLDKNVLPPMLSSFDDDF